MAPQNLNQSPSEEMDVDVPVASPFERMTRRKSSSPKVSQTDTSPSSHHSSDEVAKNKNGGGAAIITGSTRSSKEDPSIPNCSGGESNNMDGRPSRRNKPRQFDVNYIDSGKVFQAMREVEPVAECLMLDIEANILAELDKVAYEDAKLRDADNILHKILLPMAYPYSEFQPFSETIKAFPNDIDEMPQILERDYNVGPFDNGTFGYGKFEVGKSMKAMSSTEYKEGKRSATRRSEDIGVIELTTIDPEKTVTSNSENMTLLRDSQCNVDAEGEISPRRSSRKRKSLNHVEAYQSKPSYLMDYCQQLQANKKIQLSNASNAVEKKLVSVRFGGVSSRSFILRNEMRQREGENSEFTCITNNSKNKTVPILVKALLPLEVQSGRNLVIETSVENAEKLGSYDMRYGLPIDKSTGSGSRARRASTGRTRLQWTKAHLGLGSNEVTNSRSRLAYSSLLDNSRIDISLFRRPREVVLAVRLNGSILSHTQDIPFSPKGVSNRSIGNEDESVTAASGLNEKTISMAIAAVAGSNNFVKPKKKSITNDHPRIVSEPKKGEQMCFLQSEELVQKLLRTRKADAAAAKRAAKALLDQTVSVALHDGKEKVLDFVHPTLDCLPTIDGLVRVICISPGDMKPHWVPAVLALDADESKPKRCTVCFGDDSAELVESCTDCGVTVHLACCANKGSRPDGMLKWVCGSCFSSHHDAGSSYSGDSPSTSGARRRKTKAPFRFRDGENGSVVDILPKRTQSSIQCQLCPHSGGAMSFSVDHGGYVHEVCRIWQDRTSEWCSDLDKLSNNPLLKRFSSLCTICGSRITDLEKDGHVGLIRCAASGCQVRFHPMCGLLASKIATSEAQGEMPSDKLERMTILDSQLCKQYTLTMMKCTTSIKADMKTTVMPVAFCGFHNPIRDTSLFGCYPCGGIVGDAMRIPSSDVLEGAIS